MAAPLNHEVMPVSLRACWMSLVLLIAIFAAAGEMHTTLFAENPEPAAGELRQPRNLAIDAVSGRRYVLDSALRRLVAFDAQGTPLGATPLDELGIAAAEALPADPLLPIPALATTNDGAALLTLDRPTRALTITPLAGQRRTVTLPDYATNGAAALDGAGRVVVAALRAAGNSLELVLAREGADGFTEAGILDVLKDPCDGQTKHLALTGFTLRRDGQLAIGIAQGGVAAYSFVRSWLVQGTVQGGGLLEALRTTHHMTLLDSRGKPLDRYRPMIEQAGRNGYPAKPCVPLFTALARAGDGLVLSGGHTLDPFLRVYRGDGALQASYPRQAVGGQSLAVLPRETGTRIFVTNTAAGRVDEVARDGRLLGSFGTPLAYDLSAPLALAADDDGVYAVTRAGAGPRLLRFTAEGALAWSQPLAPPRGMEKAHPHLAALGNERVFIGWRQPDADGIGMVETVMADGTRGLPLWAEPWTGAVATVNPLCPTPLVSSRNGRLYVLREMKGGVRVQAFSPAGVLLQSFPAEVKGISAVLADSALGWLHPADNGIILTIYSPQGVQTGWKRVRPEPGDLLVSHTRTPWGWQGTSSTLLRLDDTLTIVEDLTLLAPNGERITTLAAFCGDRNARLYFAVENRIFVGEYRP